MLLLYLAKLNVLCVRLLYRNRKTGMCKKTAMAFKDLKPVDYIVWEILHNKVYKN